MNYNSVSVDDVSVFTSIYGCTKVDRGLNMIIFIFNYQHNVNKPTKIREE